MFFQLYGETAGWQLLGWLMVFAGLVVMNEVARRSKAGGIACFIALPAALTIYFIAIYIGAANGAEWALNNDTYVHMNSWFHYAKLYAATAGCIGFMILKFHWGKLGKSQAFKAFPFVIVAINILIAVASDFESAIRAGSLAGGWWLSSEGVWLYGGWWNVLNGIAGLFNIFCMTGWWGIYSSKDKQDMLWPDMIWVYVLAYDVWNFEYTYLNLRPTPGTAAWPFCWHRLLRRRCGTRAAGFRTGPTPWRFGACSHRYSRCSRMPAVSPPSPRYTVRAVFPRPWAAPCRPPQIRWHRLYRRSGNCSERVRLRLHPKESEGTEEESVEAGNLHGYKGLHRGNESGLKGHNRRFIAVRLAALEMKN